MDSERVSKIVCVNAHPKKLFGLPFQLSQKNTHKQQQNKNLKKKTKKKNISKLITTQFDGF